MYYFNFYIPNSLNKIITKKVKKNKEPIRVKFIELPEKLKEIKHHEKTPYIAQKSYKAKKQTKKENPLIKSAEIKDVIPKYLPVPHKIIKKASPKKLSKKKIIIKRKIKSKPKKFQKSLTKRKKIVKKFSTKKKKIVKISKSKPKPKKYKISFNKINPSLEELLKSNLINKNDNTSKKHEKQNKKGNYFLEGASSLKPNIFKPSHVYPDDIDISDSISISTQSSRYASYLHKVKRKIELVWEYPPLAGEMGIQGRLFVKFEIDRNGHLKMIKLLKSSGAKILDDEAIRAIKEAAPYPPFPKDFKIKSIKIHACFDYIIVGKEIW